MLKIKDLVIKKLNEINVEIINEKDLDKEEYLISTEDAMIIIDENKKEASISFHVAANLQDSAILALTINDIKDINVTIGDTFVFDENGKYIDGEEALLLFEAKKAESIIDGFVKHQAQSHFLMNATGYKC